MSIVESGPGSSTDAQHVASRAAACRILIGLEAKLERLLGKSLLIRPYWTFLLEVYLAEIEGKSTFQSCLAGDGSPSNPHRRSIRLEEIGALIRERDAQDHRRMILKLTPATKLAFDQALDTIFAALVDLPGTETPTPDRCAPKTSRSGPAELRPNAVISRGSSTETTNIVRGTVTVGGRVALPAAMRRYLGLQNGDTVLLKLEDHEVRIRSARSALKQIQARLRTLAPEGMLVSEELVAERRMEASRD